MISGAPKVQHSPHDVVAAIPWAQRSPALIMASHKLPHRVSFVVPALDEEAVIEGFLRELSATIDAVLQSYEIILVDDGSMDSTGAIMDRLARELPHMRVLHNRPNLGLGAAYRRGLAEARFDYVMMLCGDGGLPASSLPAILEKIGTADMIVPYMTNLKTIKTPFRYVVSRTYTHFFNLLSGHRLHYYNGLPVHRRDFLKQIDITSSGFAVQAEIILKLLKSGCTFVQVGVLAAEVKKASSALRLKNVVSVALSVVELAREVSRATPIKRSLGQNVVGPPPGTAPRKPY